MAASYRGNWRDIVVFLCAILFTIIWWNVSHSRSNWLIMFIAMIVAVDRRGHLRGRGIFRGLANVRHSRGDRPAENQ